jgi:valyl-tRNA synthetase
MSKSKGNVIDPLDVMDKYGTDAFRFTLAALAAQGRDVRLADERIEGYAKFVNKLWNATRFALMNLEDYDPASVPQGVVPPAGNSADAWILSRAASIAGRVNTHLAEYHFDRAANDLYQFVWHELAKLTLYGVDPEARQRTQAVLTHVLTVIVRLLHPIMPFVTEEIWQKLPGTSGSVMVAPFPTEKDGRADETAEKGMAVVQDVITAARNIRGEMNVPPSHKVDLIFMAPSADTRAVLADHQAAILALARAGSLDVRSPGEKPKSVAAAVAGDVEVLVQLAGVIDFDEEIRRLLKEKAKAEKDLATVQRKLDSADFVGKAPAEVVQKARDQHAALTQKMDKIDQNLARVQEMKA